MIIEPFSPFRTSEYQVKFATSAWERDEAHALRRQVFCREQQIFETDDRDAIDDYATPIVALSMLGVAADRLVGTVRIHEEKPGLWWGSRLAVHEDFRKIGALGATLIRLAVSSANAHGLPYVSRQCAGARTACSFAACTGMSSRNSRSTANRICA